MKPQSWQHVAHWYDSLIGEKGGYFHQHVIFPKTLKLLKIKPEQRILDLACGQGAFSRLLVEKGAKVIGIDASSELITRARQYSETKNITYLVDDARTLHSVATKEFDSVVSILAMQNIDPIDELCRTVSSVLKEKGKFVFVLLHPAFRTPRITGWGEDEKRKLQYRRVDRYSSPMKIPIAMHPGSHPSTVTWTYHRSLEYYIDCLRQSHMVVDCIEEWISDKHSEGAKAKQENLARTEIPMFMAIRARKVLL